MRIRVLSNIFEGTKTPVAFVGSVDSVVAKYTIIEPERWLLRILQETLSTVDYDFYPSSNNDFKNNLLYYHVGQLSTYVNIGPNTAPETFTFSNNLWYAHEIKDNAKLVLQENGHIADCLNMKSRVAFLIGTFTEIFSFSIYHWLCNK